MSLNPWALVALFCLGSIVGAGTAWSIQDLKIKSIQAEYTLFIERTRIEGEKAIKAAQEKDEQFRIAKDRADNEHETRYSALLADNERMRNERTSRGIVPKASTTSKRPNIACFDRTEFIAAIQRLDDGISRLINEGDERTLDLNIAKEWAKILK